MDFPSYSYWEAPAAKFIVIKPEEPSKSLELFVSNNPDDGYNLTFQSLAEFEAWRRQEEEMHTIEFVRGDSHGSRSNPPRFKEHVKLVCARHSRRGRKQYVKKYPERVRKLPNRKIHGVGCPAMICYKTYVDTDIVRVMYRREHSHPTGHENLVFTKRGRRILAQRNPFASRSFATPSPSTSSGGSSPEPPPIAFPPSQRTSFPSSTFSLSQEFACSTSLAHGIRSEEMSYGQLLLEHPFNPHPQLEGSCLGERDSDLQAFHPSLYPYDSTPKFSSRPPEVPVVHTACTKWNRFAAISRSVHERAGSIEHTQGAPDMLEEFLMELYLTNNLAGEVFPNDRGHPGPDVMGRSPAKEIWANHSGELFHPVFTPSGYPSRLESFEQVVFPGYRPSLDFATPVLHDRAGNFGPASALGVRELSYPNNQLGVDL